MSVLAATASEDDYSDRHYEEQGIAEYMAGVAETSCTCGDNDGPEFEAGYSDRQYDEAMKLVVRISRTPCEGASAEFFGTAMPHMSGASVYSTIMRLSQEIVNDS